MKIGKIEIPPKKKEIESLGVLDSLKETNKLKDFFVTHFKDKTIVASIDGKIKILNNNDFEEDIIQYGYLSNSVHEDPKLEESLVELENRLYNNAHNISQNDFSYVDEITKNDLSLLQKVFGEYHIDFSLYTNDLNIDETLMFLKYAKDCDVRSFKRVVDYKNNYGLKPFLSVISGGKEMGDKILALGEKLPKDIAQKVFKKYGEIVEIADNAENEVKKIYARDNISSNALESVSQKLLKKGAQLLSGLSDRLDDLSEQEIFNQLESIKTDTLIMGESYVELYKSGIKVPIEEIIGTTTERKNVKDLTEQQKKEIQDAYIKGRPENTYDNPEHIKLLKEEFEEILNDEKTYLFNVIFNGKIIAFATYNKKDKDILHIGGLTFIDDVRNSPFAVAVMNSMLKSFKDYNLEALVDSKNPILNMYIKRFGFEITGELPREENAGELYYEITKKKSPHTEKKEESLSMAA